MPWALLLDLRVLLGIALVATGVYAKVQTVRMEEARAEYAQFRADVESEAAKARVKNAQEQARMAQNATEALSDLQVRHDTIAARYERLRKSGGGSMPPCPSATGSPGPVAGGPVEPDPIARCLGILEKGDRELAKFRDLWLLDRANAASQ